MVASQNIDIVIAALGRNKKFPSQASHLFARAIIDEIQGTYILGQQLEEQVKRFTELQRRLKRARRAMESLYEEIGAGIDGAMIDALAGNELSKERGINVNRYIFQAYIETFEQKLSEQRPAMRKRGPKNLASLSVAKVIALQYYRHFGQIPAHTKPARDEEPRQTPYGRVCEAVGRMFDIKISSHAQETAVEFVKSQLKI